MLSGRFSNKFIKSFRHIGGNRVAVNLFKPAAAPLSSSSSSSSSASSSTSTSVPVFFTNSAYRWSPNLRTLTSTSSTKSNVVEAEAVEETVFEKKDSDKDAAGANGQEGIKLSPEELQKMMEEAGGVDGFGESIESKDAVVDEVPDNSEVAKGAAATHGFQAETRQLLDIVANSLYTDKEVFLRELISNASDALEKARFMQTGGTKLYQEEERPFEVRIYTDEAKGTITIQDTGIGMTEQELQSNLGTIARSGSKQFMKDLQEKGGAKDANIIGQFGVGFYSAFMVGSKVDVYTRSYKDDATAHFWTSDGTGTYTIQDAEGVGRGSKIVIHLRDNCKNFAVKHTVEGIIKKYSNFVGFPIFLNGNKMNTIQAIWTMDKNSVTEKQHEEFYRYYANAYDTPVFRMHFSTDVPIQINALFYFPERHMEKFGMGRMEPGTSLYSKKVLIKPKAKGILPEYFRFVQGVVDSEDIPLHISRENMQDSALINRINQVLTRRIIRFLDEQGKKDADKFDKWMNEFGPFIKEGICTDYNLKGDLAKLLRYESSMEKGKLISLDDYISRMRPEQKGIYYLSAPNRSLALSSPYYEGLKNSQTEVLFLYHTIDDFVMKNLAEYGKKKLISVESDTGDDSNKSEADKKESEREIELQNADLIAFITESLGGKVSSVKVSTRLVSHPAIIVDHESAAVRKMLKMMGNQSVPGMDESELPLPKQKLEINPNHPIMVNIANVKATQPELAKIVLEQIFDNALLAADILDNPRSMLPRLNSLLEKALGQK